ncbi:hypothetical protein M7I_6408 [Glarea lozoyensis 74030]|uniref:Uncharacterized protein n=1 Tax=Glarea lozoyensis (strain ATCC 74030 / MF5533) TaxID=1104152 RepID=H0EUI2_GLAL7|nr:hypothetical protein M7I_6408 [Glarea lozoyensis 74030]
MKELRWCSKVQPRLYGSTVVIGEHAGITISFTYEIVQISQLCQISLSYRQKPTTMKGLGIGIRVIELILRLCESTARVFLDNVVESIM